MTDNVNKPSHYISESGIEALDVIDAFKACPEYKTGSEIEKWENKRKQPNYYIVEDVATYFKIPVNVLIGEA